MSAISGYNPSTYYQYLQSVNSSQLAAQNLAAARKAKTGKSSEASAAASTQSSSSQSVSRGQGSSGPSALFQQVQSVVSSALQSAQQSGSTADPNQVIQSAIAQIFKNQQNAGGGKSGQPSAAVNDPDGDTDTPGVADSDAAANKNAFAQLLQSNGVDAQQFQQDFLSAVQSAQSGGGADASSVYAGLPPGSLVDTLA